MNIWLPQSLYQFKPIVFLFGALLLVMLSKNFIAIVLSILLVSYSGWIFWMRYQWRGTGKIK
jgi:hypothetical protein